MAADVLRNRVKDPVLLEFDRIHPNLGTYSFAEAHASKSSHLTEENVTKIKNAPTNYNKNNKTNQAMIKKGISE